MALALSNGDRVCIIGGGPAGSLAAIHLLQMAAREQLNLEVLIFEPRDFSTPGPGGCNRCAGVLSTRLIEGLEALGLHLPSKVIQASIESYAVHLGEDVIPISRPDPRRHIVSVYRGGGPRYSPSGPQSAFDGFLLQAAERRGASRIPARVRKVTWEDRPVVHLAREAYPADLLVLATGVNSRAPLDISFGYRPPPTSVMAQDEFMRPSDWTSDQIQAYFGKPKGLTFGALIPKGDYLNVSLLGTGLATDAVPDFLEAQGLSSRLTEFPGSLCGCTPRIATGPGRGYYGDRWVAVGDAAVTRLYKDGIGSAYMTSQSAMSCAVHQGISRHAFRRSYAPLCRNVTRDNRFGRLLYRLWALTLRRPSVLGVWKAALAAEADEPLERRVHTRILWGMFTGDEPYRDLFLLAVGRTSLRALWNASRMGVD